MSIQREEEKQTSSELVLSFWVSTSQLSLLESTEFLLFWTSPFQTVERDYHISDMTRDVLFDCLAQKARWGVKEKSSSSLLTGNKNP